MANDDDDDCLGESEADWSCSDTTSDDDDEGPRVNGEEDDPDAAIAAARSPRQRDAWTMKDADDKHGDVVVVVGGVVESGILRVFAPPLGSPSQGPRVSFVYELFERHPQTDCPLLTRERPWRLMQVSPRCPVLWL